LLALVTWLFPLSDDCLAGVEDSLAAVPSSPPDLTGTWQFFQRTALPPRAPSFVS
jgi:hypothetical protein